MPTFEDAILIRCTPLAAYELTQDYGRRLDWDPFLREARLVNGDKAAPGVRAWCVTKGGLGMETEYVSCQPGRVAAVFMTKGPWPVAKFAGAWHFASESQGTTKVRFKYHLRGRPAVITPLVVWWFRREMNERLEALKSALERA
jgi:hypothetical protein